MLVNKKQVHILFMLGKARVAPLKQTTIPRLELTAAVLAVRVDRMLRKWLSLQLGQSSFWANGMAILKYNKGEKRQFHTFRGKPSSIHKRSHRSLSVEIYQHQGESC